MRWILAGLAALLLASQPGAARATESTRLAIEAGFLLGHAQRCGVPSQRIEAVAERMRGAILAAAQDARDQKAAGTRFDLVFLASSLPARDPHALLPSCQIVVAQFRRLERHSLPLMGE
jgi:hypothetical protein